jgi:hypothetical protein
LDAASLKLPLARLLRLSLTRVFARLAFQTKIINRSIGSIVPDDRNRGRHIEQSENRIILRPSSKEHGAPPQPDPKLSSVYGNEDFATSLFEGLQENNVDFVVGLPCSGLSAAQAICMKAQSMRYVAV